MTAILTDASAGSLARATLANLADLNRDLARSPHAEALDRPGLFRFRTPVAHEFYNGIVCAKPPGASAAIEIAETLDYFRRRGPRRIIWWFDPPIAAESWRAPLAAQGFVAGSEIPGMAAELTAISAPRATAIEVRRVRDRGDRALWARAFVDGYGFPLEWAPDFADLFGGLDAENGAYRGYLAIEDRRVVGTSTGFVSAGVCGLYDVAVIPSARGRGIGTAVTMAPFAEAAALGVRIGVLHASPLGQPMYERMGFRIVCPVEHFVWKEESC